MTQSVVILYLVGVSGQIEARLIHIQYINTEFLKSEIAFVIEPFPFSFANIVIWSSRRNRAETMTYEVDPEADSLQQEPL